MDTTNTQDHTGRSVIALTLQAEGAAVGAACILAYAASGGSWWLFAALILLPDIAMLGYLGGKRSGAVCYNLGHSYLGPLALGGAAYAFEFITIGQVALIWGAHIGLDRAIGYGLKYAAGFKDTHLGRV